MAMIIKIAKWAIIISIALFVAYVVYPPQVPRSPLSRVQPSPRIETPTKPYVVLGFLPYWNIKKLSQSAITGSTHVAYFALRLDGTGHIVTHVNKREEEPGYTNYKRFKVNNLNKQIILTFAQQDQQALTSILRNKNAHRQAISTIVQYTEEIGGAGVNIDFEPLGETTLSDRANFSMFMRDLQIELQKKKMISSVSMYASAVSNPRIWDLKELAQSTDFIVVMTYDYTLPGSIKTGPNSPLRGAGTLFEHDIISNLAEITSVVPHDKVLLGIPFYGYEWDTTDGEKYTHTESRGSLASLERIQKLVNENTLELLWDRNSLTPYAVRRSEGKIISQIYYEDINSIRLKLDLVKQAGLGGIAIWALGYEGDDPALWREINRTLSTP